MFAYAPDAYGLPPRPASGNVRPVSALDRPIFVVAPPQSGTPLVAEALGRLPGVRTLPAEGRKRLDATDELRPALRGHDSNRRTAEDAGPGAAERLRAALEQTLVGDAGRIIDSTPRNALRVPYLDAVFPDASFIYVYREPRDTLSSMVAAWESGEYVTYPGLPGWPGPPWSLLLIPDWRELAEATVPEIVAEQWIATTRTLLADLDELAPERWCVADYARLVSEPFAELERLAAFLGLEWDSDALGSDAVPGPVEPDPEDETARSEELQAVLPRTIGLAERARDLISEPLSRRPTATPDFSSPLRSSHTGGFARVLERAVASLLITTGESGALVCVRRDGARLNTHFRELDRPAGIAADADRITVACASELWTYERSADALAALPADAEHDACFVPRSRTLTGDLGELAVCPAPDGVWVAAREPSMLALARAGHPLDVRWRPPATEGADPLPLTGLVARDGQPAYVTAQPTRAEDGAVVAVEGGRMVAAGLSLPNSPVLTDGRLLMVEGGEGALIELDPKTGSAEVIAHVPGLCSGLAVHEGVAFVGLSRPGADAPPLPIHERFDEHHCGIWAIDLATGNELGSLRFEDSVTEVAGVAVLPGVRFPEIATPESAIARAALDLIEP